MAACEVIKGTFSSIVVLPRSELPIEISLINTNLPSKESIRAVVYPSIWKYSQNV